MEKNTILLYDDETNTTECYKLHSFLFEIIPSGIAIATINTPKNLNALSPNVFAEFFVILEYAKRCPDIKVIIWTGTGRAFCSGLLLKGDKSVKIPKKFLDLYEKFQMTQHQDDVAQKRLTLAFWRFPKISIVAVNGLAVGGAANICLANFHDLVICSTEARFKYPFLTLGITPELGSSRILPFIVGMVKAKEMLLTEDWFTAEEAKNMGLVNKVVSPSELMPTTIKLAQTLVGQKYPHSLILSKKLINSHLMVEMEKALDEENKIMVEALDKNQQRSFLESKL
eukprot:c12189_g1_i1.p1 GENE.c12189_g1_i1~~c12189_g1_i1.p1  ORF type:complete len:297 (+),score=94.35 c12189_g1_i1:42-893(+)